MFENIAAIDIGATSIKMIKVRNGIRNFQIRSLSYEDIDAGNPDYRSAAGAALKKMLAEDPVSGFTIVSNLPMENSIIRNIAFPFSDVKKIAEAIPFEAEENVPFRLDELVMDFQTLHSGRTDEGRVLLAASRRETVNDHVRLLQEADMIPAHLGLEANSLFSCYSHFNRVAGENVIQIDIGYSKSIINIIIDGRLQYTRSCPASLKAIITSIGSLLGIPAGQALGVFHELNIDMTALDNNLQRDYYRKLDIKKNQMKSIYSIASGVLDDLAEQITLTMGACRVDNPDVQFSRILISGGGSGIAGLAARLSREMGLPVVPTPFPDEYREQRLRNQFPIALGMILAYRNNRRDRINFLKGEFLPDITRSSRKIYYLASLFLGASLIIMIFNLVFSLIMASGTNSRHGELLVANYRKYFRERDIPDNVIEAARKKLIRERKELEAMEVVISGNGSTLESLKGILSFFGSDGSFDLKNLVINESIVRIDGTASASAGIEQFKDKLQQSGRFDSVSLNINSSRKNEISFTITIRIKSESGVKRAM